ncbi:MULTISPECIES: ECF transporter S component [unclassified Streptococcus]|uniref:ECF transporter S component n=1 Tax=unclassified Streptococcus TaxID=2608887 RepID=UPI0011B38FEA|nr:MULTISPECIES: ECF transporter S component [unclassified Streptococcus]TWS94067.1 ECF transporter S component [Streptococcus sp. sy018]TWT09887.1 ECF transporter S component [Streptococcus sp. sy004]
MLQTRQMVLIAILSALSFSLMLFGFPIIPGADFLKVELSILPILLGLYLFDLKTAYLILGLRTVLKFVLNNRGVNDWIGLPMNVLALAIFVACFALIWKKKETVSRYVMASLVGTVVLTLSMLLLNWVYGIPLYAKLANFDISQFIGTSLYLFGMVLPFNLVQGLIFSLSFALIYRLLKPILSTYRYEK